MFLKDTKNGINFEYLSAKKVGEYKTKVNFQAKEKWINSVFPNHFVCFQLSPAIDLITK